MPNVAPRGLHAYPPPAGPWKPALDVFGVPLANGAWAPAQYVWGWCTATAKWEVLWAKVVAPATGVTAVYQPTGTQVLVSWVLPTPNTVATWEVRRPNGTLVGSVAYNATSLVDPSPLPGTGTYTVKGVNGPDESAEVASNSLTITLQPATVTATAVSGNVKVDWTPHATEGDPDTWSVWNVNESEWSATGLAGTVRTATITGLIPGTSYTFTVYPYLSGTAVANQGTGRTTAAAGVPAAAPTAVALAAIDPPTTGEASSDQIQLTWAAPASGSVTGYEVESSTNGTTWTASSDDASPVVFVSAVPLYARVRATSAGGAGAWVQVGPVSPHADVPPGVPGGVTLTALNPPLSTLRLAWTAGTGAVSYNVEYSTNNSTWTGSSDDVTPSDWATTTATGYMRVRSVSPGGVSAWVTKGPVAAINDVTPPTTPVITSWKPETSYGRMVCRFTTAASADINSYRCDYKTDSGAWVTGSWVACNPSTAIAWVCPKTFVATDIAGVAVYYKDDTGNVTPADTASYTLVASPKIVSATDSATWRVDEWRTDGVSGSTGVMYGWTSTGHNVGCWFYGEALQDFISTHTVTTMYVEYVRDGSSQGMSAASAVMTQVHTHATQPAGAPSYTTTGEATGTAVARVTSPPGDGGYCYLNASQIALLAGSYKGICHYDGVANGNTYMRIYPAGTVGDGRTCGKVGINHLG